MRVRELSPEGAWLSYGNPKTSVNSHTDGFV